MTISVYVTTCKTLFIIFYGQFGYKVKSGDEKELMKLLVGDFLLQPASRFIISNNILRMWANNAPQKNRINFRLTDWHLLAYISWSHVRRLAIE